MLQLEFKQNLSTHKLFYMKEEGLLTLSFVIDVMDSLTGEMSHCCHRLLSMFGYTTHTKKSFFLIRYQHESV